MFCFFKLAILAVLECVVQSWLFGNFTALTQQAPDNLLSWRHYVAARDNDKSPQCLVFYQRLMRGAACLLLDRLRQRPLLLSSSRGSSATQRRRESAASAPALGDSTVEAQPILPARRAVDSTLSIEP